MATPRTILAALLLAALFAPASSSAAPRAKAPSPLTAAADVGRHFWGAVPCQGQIKVLAQRAVPAGLAPDSDAWVTFDSPQGANNLAAPAGSYTNCTIAFARWRWPTSASMREDWDLVCATMTHELGHLLGRPHDALPGSVMAPVFTDSSSVPAPCRAARPARSARRARA